MVGEVIAVGIFLTPGGCEIAWLLDQALDGLAGNGTMAACGALCYGDLAARFPEAGGSYVYLREAFGRPLAFLYGWMALLVMAPGLTAALAVGMAGYVGYIFNLSPLEIKAIAINTVLLLAAINVRGIRPGAWLLWRLTILKLGLLLFLMLWGFGLELGKWSNFRHSSRSAQVLPHCPASGWRSGSSLLFIRRLVGRNQSGRRSQQSQSYLTARFDLWRLYRDSCLRYDECCLYLSCAAGHGGLG